MVLKTITTKVESDKRDKGPFQIRFHFVRHAETEANRAGIVLGQSDSPLTYHGIQQAIAAHNGYGKNRKYYKVFSSDLGRCVQTARLILYGENATAEKYDDDCCKNDSDTADYGGNKNDENHNVHLCLDKRLRERAKGAREGRCKLMSYEEAVEEIMKTKRIKGESRLCESDDLPLLESEAQVMQRFQNWLEETIQDACKHCRESGEKNSSLDVLVVSHSGTLRIAFERLVGKQLPVDAHREQVCKHTNVSRLVIPNTSKTVIQFTKAETCSLATPHNALRSEAVVVRDKDEEGTGKMLLSLWNATLLDYTNLSHLQRNGGS